MPYSALNADQRGGTTASGKPSFTIDQAAAQLTREGLSWSATLGQPATVTYAFRATAPASMPSDTAGFQQIVFQQYTAIQSALDVWSKVANITFVQIGTGPNPLPGAYSDAASILIGNYTSGEANAAAFAFLPGSRDAASRAGDIWFNGSLTENRYMGGRGSSGFLTALHEIGHAIGLSHPGDYDAENQTLTYAHDARYNEDSLEYSIMSYFDLEDSGGSIVSSSLYPFGPLIDDIAAAQRLYGANMTTNAGDTVYGLAYGSVYPGHSTVADLPLNVNASSLIWGTIWDGGGIDTIDFTASSFAERIDLRPGSFSDVQGGIGTLSIALGAIIENAVGGYANDILIGNDVANLLVGGAGNDTLTGGLGDDTLVGGDGADVAVIAAAAATATFAVAENGDVVIASADGRDTLRGIETARFSDRDLATTGMAGTDEIYRAFMGRGAASGEILYWAGRIAVGGTLGEVRSAVLGDPAGVAYTGQAVSGLYQSYVGRTATTAEATYWTNQLRAGSDYGAVRAALVADPAGQALAAQTIGGFYRDYMGRSPSAAETGYWTGRVATGTSYATVRLAIASDFSAYAHEYEAVSQLYRDHLNRAPSFSEWGYWVDQVRTGTEFAQVRAVLANDPSAAGAAADVVQSAYYRVFLRSPGSAELAYWQAQARQGTTLPAIADAIVHDPSAIANVRQSIASYYQDYIGHPGNADEINYWSTLMYNVGYGLGTIRYQMLHSNAGIAHTAATMASLYQTYLGRAPSAAESSYWSGRIDNLSTFADVRQALVNDPSGVVHTRATVDALYHDYLGRAPAAAELSYWDGQVRAGTDFTGVRAAILADPAGIAHTAATIGALYVEYGGRAASAAEVAYWAGQVRGGTDFAGVRTALLADPLGQAHTDSTLASLYQEYFGHAPSASDVSVWSGLLRGGATFGTVVDALLTDPASAAGGVRRYAATAGADTIALGADIGHNVVAGFDPAADRIDLRGAGYAGVNLFDGNHLRQVTAIGGQPDVLVTFDAHHDILLTNVLLAELTSGDFLLG